MLKQNSLNQYCTNMKCILLEASDNLSVRVTLADNLLQM